MTRRYAYAARYDYRAGQHAHYNGDLGIGPEDVIILEVTDPWTIKVRPIDIDVEFIIKPELLSEPWDV